MTGQLGIIFDFNGVIINDERIHEQSWRLLYQDRQYSEKQFRQHFFGQREKEIFEFVSGRSLSDDELQLLSDQRISIVKKLLEAGIYPSPGLPKFLQLIAKAKIPYAIATSSRRPYVTYILELLTLTGLFQHIVTAEEVSHGKPDPEVFLKAAKLIKIEPKDCIVIEDTQTGIQAGHRAGMKVIALTSTHKRQELESADVIIDSFEELNLDTIQRLQEERETG